MRCDDVDVDVDVVVDVDDVGGVIGMCDTESALLCFKTITLMTVIADLQV